MTQHRIHIERVIPRFGRRKYRAWCTCDVYQSRPFNFPGQAESAGFEHVKAKEPSRDG